jgi:hypothetical protein
MKKTKTFEQIVGILRGFEPSGKTIKEYCQEKKDCLLLQRFALEDVLEFNAESHFLARVRALLKREGYCWSEQMSGEATERRRVGILLVPEAGAQTAKLRQTSLRLVVASKGDFAVKSSVSALAA